MPLIEGFRSTSLSKAFALNSLVVSLAAVAGLWVHSYLDKKAGKISPQDRDGNSPIGLALTFFATFTTSFLVFWIVHFLFGFGDTLLLPNSE